jgi:hypothetical protein
VNQKKILLVSAAFHPQNTPRAFRATELAVEFSAMGNEVTVLCHNPSLETFQFGSKNKIHIKSFGKRRFDNFLPGLTFWKRGIKKILNLLMEFPDIEYFFMVKRALRMEHGYDLMISFAVPYPVHWGCAWSWDKGNTANLWVADCGDPYMGVKYDIYKKPFYMACVEKWMFRKADFIAITRKSFIGNYYKEFWPKIIEIPQGFNFDKIRKAIYVKNEIPTFAFAGTLSTHIRNPGNFLNYLIQLNIDFEFLVYTRAKEVVLPYEKRLCGKMKILDIIPREELIYKLSKVDFLINFEFDPLTQSPSKLIDYSIIGRPILSLSFNNLDTNAIDEFLIGNYSNSFVVDNIEQYHIKNVATKFLCLV